MVFPLIIHLRITVSPKHLCISRASYSVIEVNFLNQNPCMPSCVGIFQFTASFSVTLSEFKCITVSGPFLSACNSFSNAMFFFWVFNPNIRSLAIYFSLSWKSKVPENYYHHNYITPCRFFTPALADNLSLESKLQQVSSSLLNPSQYSGWS